MSINLFRFSDFFWGYGIRWAAYKRLCKKFGKTAVIMPSVYAESLENLSVGEKVVLHEFSYVSCGNTEIVIEDNVAIACRCTLVTNKHNYEKYSINSSERLMGNTFKRITIKKNAWIGASVVILGGSYIGEGSVIAAGSVVNSTTKPFSLYGGVPAKYIKSFNKIYVD
jgi:acetyltransferase-like isoleucine patch superfamily enzyme